jgi:hypothetical protein
MASSNTNQQSIAWDDVIKKEARGTVDDSDFGEVQEIGQHYVLTQKGMVSKDKFYIPKYLVQGYDGDIHYGSMLAKTNYKDGNMIHLRNTMNIIENTELPRCHRR